MLKPIVTLESLCDYIHASRSSIVMRSRNRLKYRYVPFVFSFSMQLMEGYQNGRPGRAAVGCVSEVYRHVSGDVTILLRDVAGNPVALAWLPSK